MAGTLAKKRVKETIISVINREIANQRHLLEELQYRYERVSDDEETRETIRSAWEKYQLLLEPHGATGWAGLQHFIEETKIDGLMVSVETAHPAKFPEEIDRLLSITPDLPKSLARIEELEESYIQLPNDYQQFRNLLLEKYRP